VSFDRGAAPSHTPLGLAPKRHCLSTDDNSASLTDAAESARRLQK